MLLILMFGAKLYLFQFYCHVLFFVLSVYLRFTKIILKNMKRENLHQ